MKNHKLIVSAILLVIVTLFPTIIMADIQKYRIVGHDEMNIEPAEIVHLPGLGLALWSDGDTLMFLDAPDLSAICFREPTRCRSLVALRSGIYAADGDSICRLATDSLPSRFVGRLDNEQFTLHQATDSTFYALTADEEFSCVYEIYPEISQCEPIASFKGPIQKIESNGKKVVMWIDDALMSLADDGIVTPVYSADDISDFTVTPLGIMIATAEGLVWLTGPDKGAVIVKEPVKALWWDDADVLYYLTAEGDLIATRGLLERFVSLRR